MSYLSEVITDSPLHYWRFADPGGVRAADIGSGARSSMIPAVGGAMPPSMPYSGFASDGGSMASGQGRLSNAPFVSASAWSIECCFYSARVSSSVNAVFEIAYATNVFAGFSLFAGAVPHWYFGTGPTDVFGTNATPVEQWMHLVLTNDGTNVRGYRDAILEVTQSGPAVTGIMGGAFAFRSHSSTDSQPGGWISELAVYSHVLTPTRINAHFLALPSSSGPVWRGAGSSDVSAILDQLSDIRNAVIRTPAIPGQV